MSNSVTKIITYAGILLLVTGLSYFTFSKLFPVNNSLISSDSKSVVDNKDDQAVPTKKGITVFEGPKTEICPINGTMHTATEKDMWSQRRPLLVMIENHANSRPQSGLQNADIVYEAVAEGGITRFMGVFYCDVLKGSENKYDVGPVRSARSYFVDLASEYADYPLYAHVGGANCSAATNGGPCTSDKRVMAVEQMASYGWNTAGTWGDLSQFSLSYKVCRREPERTGEVKDTEHTMYCSTKELWNVAENRGLTNETVSKKTSWDKNFKSWSFKQEDKSISTSVSKISFDFWGYKDYSVVWEYDSKTNEYIRSNGGQKHIDFNFDEPISTKNIVIQHVKEIKSVDEHLHNIYEVVGSGKAVLLQNGTKTDIIWSKTNRTSRTIYKDASGKEINFVPGKIWVEILSLDAKVNYEGQQ